MARTFFTSLFGALLLALAPSASAQAQLPNSKPVPLNAQQVREDLALAKAMLQEVHPELYRYRSKARVDAALDAAGRNARNGDELFLGLLAAVSSIQDHHTWVEPSEASVEGLAAARIYLPFAIRFLDGRLYVVRPEQVAPGALPPSGQRDPETASGLRPGDEIVAIDRISAQNMLRRLLPLVASDGDTVGYRLAALNGSPNYPAGSAFYAYWPYAFPKAAGDGVVELKIRPAGGGAQRSVTVPLIDRPAWLSRVGASLGRPVAIDKLWSLRFEDDVAILRAGSFLIWGAEAQAAVGKVLFGALAELQERKPRRLVIDLRNNGGGQDTGIELLRGFATQPFTYQTASIFNRLKLSPALTPHLRTYQGPVADLPETGFTRREDGRWEADAAGTPRSHSQQEPFPGAYTGDVVVLVDGGNASAATMFAAKAQSLGRARIIGEPTGGSRLGPSAGTVLFGTLPHSGVRLTIPVIRITMHEPLRGPDRGVQPDVVIRTTIADVVAGRDAAMAVALAR